jgi:hypothetical protein
VVAPGKQYDLRLPAQVSCQFQRVPEGHLLIPPGVDEQAGALDVRGGLEGVVAQQILPQAAIVDPGREAILGGVAPLRFPIEAAEQHLFVCRAEQGQCGEIGFGSGADPIISTHARTSVAYAGAIDERVAAQEVDGRPHVLLEWSVDDSGAVTVPAKVEGEHHETDATGFDAK